MKPTVASLLIEAQSAPPPEREAKGSWACWYPVVAELVSNGRNVTQAVEWLQSKGVVTSKNFKQAYRALLALHKRKTKNA